MHEPLDDSTRSYGTFAINHHILYADTYICDLALAKRTGESLSQMYDVVLCRVIAA